MKRLVETINDNTIRITVADQRWYIKNKENYASVTWIAGYYPKGIGYMKWLASLGWDEAEAIKIARGTQGSKVHQAIVDLTDGKEVPMDAKYWVEDNNQTEELDLNEYECLMTFVDWHKTEDHKIIDRELVVFSEQYKFAGTMDRIDDMKDYLRIIDYKTGQNIWMSHKIQLAAYKHAYIEMTGETKEIKLAILQLGYRKNKRGWKLTEIPDYFDLFLNTREIWKNECATQKPLVKDYPVSLKLEEK